MDCWTIHTATSLLTNEVWVPVSNRFAAEYDGLLQTNAICCQHRVRRTHMKCMLALSLWVADLWVTDTLERVELELMLDGLVLRTCVLACRVVIENWHWSKLAEGPHAGAAEGL